ncbi:MAG: cyclic pyranopterin monophosphate synthase MoaC [Gammaproteobacteria bacterium]|nr:cyclic pyranopterin monophosphate synthase MoaC [Gammaproteobacteria bacterium]
MTDFSHLDERGTARMVDVSDKGTTKRFARASAEVVMAPATLAAILAESLPKGDVFAAARIAGIAACKRCADLIPLCHPLPLTSADVSIEAVAENRLQVVVTCRVTGKTGVEMEALTGASIAALTIYDMCKSADRAMSIESLRLLEKSGGASGGFTRAQ